MACENHFFGKFQDILPEPPAGTVQAVVKPSRSHGQGCRAHFPILSAARLAPGRGWLGVEGVVPMTRTHVPAARTRVPMTRTHVLVTRTSVPAACTRVPVTRTRIPAARTRVPVTRTRAPVARTRVPMTRIGLQEARGAVSSAEFQHFPVFSRALKHLTHPQPRHRA